MDSTIGDSGPVIGSLGGLLEESEVRRRLFLVLGPESSGTRLLTRILIHGGCAGDYSHSQRWDKKSWGSTPNVVWRRSVPHNRQPLHLKKLAERVESGRIVSILVTTRDVTACASSQVRAGHSPDTDTAYTKICRAYESIFQQLNRMGLHFLVVPYESLVLHPCQVQHRLWDLLDLPGGIPVPVTDQNAKHYTTPA